jgi:Arc/MetJ family transcription regulator
MRTTLTLDDDVVARLKQLKGFSSFQEAVNEALRAGLNSLEASSAVHQRPYRVQAVDLGLKIQNVDNIAEILDLIEKD